VKRLAVIGRRSACIDYCRANGIDPHDRERVVLISTPMQTRGLVGPLTPMFVGPIIEGEREIVEMIKVINISAGA
jgi:hypothetical protein